MTVVQARIVSDWYLIQAGWAMEDEEQSRESGTTASNDLKNGEVEKMMRLGWLEWPTSPT